MKSSLMMRSAVIAAIVVIMNYSVPGHADSILEAMRPEDRVDYVIARIEEREAALSNFEYSMTKTGQAINRHTNETKPLSSMTMTLRRKDGTLWANMSQFDGGIQDGKREYTSWLNWDGDRARGYTQSHIGSKRLAGSIQAEEWDIFATARTNTVLGLRTGGFGPTTTLPQWIMRQLQAPDVTVTVEVKDEQGKPLVGLRSEKNDENGKRIITYWFDPALGYMITKYTSDDGRARVDYVVKDARLVDGVWIPMEVVHTVDTTDMDYKNEIVYKLESIKLNSVKEEDVKIDFPVGCTVVDMIAKVAWKVTEGGIEMQPLYDPTTGKVIDPRGEGVEKVIDDVLKSSGQEGPVRVSPDPVTTTQEAIIPDAPLTENKPTRGIWFYLLPAAAAILIVAGTMLWRKRCKTKK